MFRIGASLSRVATPAARNAIKAMPAVRSVARFQSNKVVMPILTKKCTSHVPNSVSSWPAFG